MGIHISFSIFYRIGRTGSNSSIQKILSWTYTAN